MDQEEKKRKGLPFACSQYLDPCQDNWRITELSFPHQEGKRGKRFQIPGQWAGRMEPATLCAERSLVHESTEYYE